MIARRTAFRFCVSNGLILFPLRLRMNYQRTLALTLSTFKLGYLDILGTHAIFKGVSSIYTDTTGLCQFSSEIIHAKCTPSNRCWDIGIHRHVPIFVTGAQCHNVLATTPTSINHQTWQVTNDK